MTELSKELLGLVHHLITIIQNKNIDYHIDWAVYHARRACQHLPEDVAKILTTKLQGLHPKNKPTSFQLDLIEIIKLHNMHLTNITDTGELSGRGVWTTRLATTSWINPQDLAKVITNFIKKERRTQTLSPKE